MVSGPLSPEHVLLLAVPGRPRSPSGPAPRSKLEGPCAGRVKSLEYGGMALSPLFNQALTFAATLHAGQLRKGTRIPYIAHLLGVASIAVEHGADEDEAIAALLHDAIEDQGGAFTGEEIHRRFGPTVVDIVKGCTDAAR